MSRLKHYFATGLIGATALLVAACSTSDSDQESQDQTPVPTFTEAQTPEPTLTEDELSRSPESQNNTAAAEPPESALTDSSFEPESSGLPAFEFADDYREDLRRVDMLPDEEVFDLVTSKYEEMYCGWSNKDDGERLHHDLLLMGDFKGDRTEEAMVITHHRCPEEMDHLVELYVRWQSDQ